MTRQNATDSGQLDADVIVVGAGLSGLVAARELQRRGIAVLVLESADRIGGRVMGVTTALGSRLDLGGQWIGADHHTASALAAELGITQYPMHGRGLPHIIHQGRKLSPLSPATLTAGLTLAGLELLTRTGATMRWNNSTIESWLQKVPGRAARRLLEVTALISWTADLDRYSIHAMSRMIRRQGGLRTILATTNGAQDSLLVEGAGSMTDTLAVELGSRVLTGHRVTSITRTHSDVTVRTEARTFRGARAIITVPAPMAGRIEHLPALPEQRIALERNTYMGSVYKAIAVYERPFWRDRGRGEFLFLDNPGRAVFDTTAPGGPGHLCILVAGPQARELDRLALDVRRQALLRPLVDHLGLETLATLDWHEKAWHLDGHTGGGYISLPKLGTTEGIMPLAHVAVGNLHWAGSETASDHPGYLDGAIQAGERAASEVANALAGA